MHAAARKVRLPVLGATGPRSIMLQDRGNPGAEDVYLCLPGLLETSASFQDLGNALERGARIVSIDFAGRGASDRLPSPSDYRMSTCLADLVAAVSWLKGSVQSTAGKLPFFGMHYGRRVPARIHLVGNSMGGLLGAHFINCFPGQVQSLILNEAACVLPWSGLISMFGRIGRSAAGDDLRSRSSAVADLGRQLDVDPHLITAVMQPAHLDLPHSSGMQGIGFESSFAKLEVPIMLLHSTASALVTPAVVERMKQVCKQLTLFSTQGSHHPVPFTKATTTGVAEFAAGLRKMKPSMPAIYPGMTARPS